MKLQFAKYARAAPLHLKELVIYNVALYALKHTYKLGIGLFGPLVDHIPGRNGLLIGVFISQFYDTPFYV